MNSDIVRIAAIAVVLMGIIASPATGQFIPAPTDSALKTAAPPIPPTAVGDALRAWLNAFNSGDSAQIADYLHAHPTERDVGEWLRFRQSTGEFTLLTIERSEPQHIAFTLRRARNPTTVYGELSLSATAPVRADGPTLVELGPGVGVAALQISSDARRRVIGRVATLLDSLYVFPDAARRTGDSLRARHARGDYEREINGMTFSHRLNSELRELTNDLHVDVLFSAMPFPPPPPAGVATPLPAAYVSERARREAAERNCGFQRVERLDENVGYIKFDTFDDVIVCEETATAALSFVANTRALIVDLRENSGGAPDMVALVASYLFDSRTLLNTMWTRHTGHTEEFWSRDSVAGLRFGGAKPVYVLTSSRTYSAAEEFAYDVQALGRATIVGESTRGGAHPVRLRRIDEHFAVGIPHARAINPVTGTNWEGVGVAPDIRVPASDALSRVRELLRNKNQ